MDDNLIIRSLGRAKWWFFPSAMGLGLMLAVLIHIYLLEEFGYWSWDCLCDTRH